MTSTSIQIAPDGPTFSRTVAGLMWLADGNLSASDTLDWIKGCIDVGVTTFDNADIYGSHTCEELFGAALALDPSLRGQMQLVTKCGIKPTSPNRPDHKLDHYDTSRMHILWSVDNSLKMMQTDHIDLLLIHRPDPLMDADEIASAFNLLNEQGKVLHFGVSNFTPSQFDLIQSRLHFPLVTNQVEFSVMHMEPMHDGAFDQLQQKNISPMAWSPLGGGGLFKPNTDQTRRLNETMSQIAQNHNAGIDQIAYAWILAHPADVLPVTGTSKIERVRAAVEAESIKLDRQEWFSIWVASAGHGVP